jgi:hypothetical protein
MTKQRETRYFDPTTVLSVLRERDRGMAWSRIAAAILGLPVEQVRLPDVRGVRDACYSLERAGLVRRRNTGVYRAVEIV